MKKIKKTIVFVLVSSMILSYANVSAVTIEKKEIINEKETIKSGYNEINIHSNSEKSASTETKQIILQSGKSYEIKNIGTNDISLNWENGIYDIVYYYSNGNIKSYTKDKIYSGIDLKAGEKAKVTVKGNTPTQLYVVQDYSSNIVSKEISTEAIKYITLSTGKSYEIKNTGTNDISLNWENGIYDIVY
ncbi:MAG: hypothetical protein ACI33J_10995, partial [Clostridium sp.]